MLRHEEKYLNERLRTFLNEQKNSLSEKTIDSPCAAGDAVENCFNYVNQGKE